MDVPELRTWIIFYLLSFVVLLVALSITSHDEGQLWIGFTLIIVVVGVNFALLFSDLKRNKERQDFMRKVSKIGSDDTEVDSAGRRW